MDTTRSTAIADTWGPAVGGLLLVMVLMMGIGCRTWKGGFVNREEHVFLIKENPSKYRVMPDSTVGEKIGSLSGRFGEEIAPFGFFEDGHDMHHSYLLYVKPDSFYIRDAVPYDDFVYSYRVGPSFTATLSDDPTMWGRAVEYVSQRSGRPVKLASDNLIESARSRDSASIGYVVSKISERDRVVYHLSATSNAVSFSEGAAIRKLGFYMITGYNHN